MKQILVAGGAGGVGEGITAALLDAGHTVIVPSRSAAKLALLRARLAERKIVDKRLVAFEGEIGTHDGAIAIREDIAAKVGRIDTLIPSLGGWWEGRLLDASPGIWDSVMHEMLRTHIVFAHVFLPVLQAQKTGGRYIGIGGGAAYVPVENSSLVSIAAAAQLMFTRALRAEISDPAIDIIELVIDGPVRTRDSETIAGPDWITADEVGRIALELVATGRSDDATVQTDGPIVRMRPRKARPA